jgi:hypothetical protein
MIKDPQKYLQHWEKKHNPDYPNAMPWSRLTVNVFLADYKKQLKRTVKIQENDTKHLV